MIRALSLPIDVDLLGFTKHLSALGIAHRISEESGKQVIWVAVQEDVIHVSSAFQSWQSNSELDALASDVSESDKSSPLQPSPLKGFINSTIRLGYYSPVTLLLFSVCLLVAIVSRLGSNAGAVSFFFYPYLPIDSLFSLIAGLSNVEYLLRTLLPMFLHFGELHLVFNMLWLWYFGRQLESVHSSGFFLFLVLVISFSSNTLQYLVSASSNFGGMSGVVYGLVGYAWVIHKAMPKSHLVLSKNIMSFFVVALIVMELLASSMIATAAHVGGLVSGAILGLGAVFYYRQVLKVDAVGRQPIAR